MIGLLKLPLLGLLLVVSSMSQDTEELPGIKNNEENVEETNETDEINLDSSKTNNIEKPTYEYPTMSSTKCDESNNCSLPNILDNTLVSSTPTDDARNDSVKVDKEISKPLKDSLTPTNRRSYMEPLNRDLFSNTQAIYTNDSKDDEDIDRSYIYPVDNNEQSSEIKLHNGSTISNESGSATIPKEQDEQTIEFKRDQIGSGENNSNHEVGPQRNYSSIYLKDNEARSSSNATTINSAIEPTISILTAEDGFSNASNFSKLEDSFDTVMNVSAEKPLSSRSLGLVRTIRPSSEDGSGASRTSFPMVENIAKFLSAIIKPTDPFAILSDVLPKPKPIRSNVLDAIEAEPDTDDGPIVYPFCENPPCMYLRCPEPCTCPKFCYKSSKPSCKCCPECLPLQ